MYISSPLDEPTENHQGTGERHTSLGEHIVETGL